MNKYENVCKTFLSGCLNVKQNEQEKCNACLEAFLKAIKYIAKNDESYKDNNRFCEKK